MATVNSHVEASRAVYTYTRGRQSSSSHFDSPFSRPFCMENYKWPLTRALPDSIPLCVISVELFSLSLSPLWSSLPRHQPRAHTYILSRCAADAVGSLNYLPSRYPREEASQTPKSTSLSLSLSLLSFTRSLLLAQESWEEEETHIAPKVYSAREGWSGHSSVTIHSRLLSLSLSLCVCGSFHKRNTRVNSILTSFPPYRREETLSAGVLRVVDSNSSRRNFKLIALPSLLSFLSLSFGLVLFLSLGLLCFPSAHTPRGGWVYTSSSLSRARDSFIKGIRRASWVRARQIERSRMRVRERRRSTSVLRCETQKYS